MNILLSSAELDHFAKVGGLADISTALAIEWEKLGHNPIVVLPKYQCIDHLEEIEFTDTGLSFTICSLPIHIFKSVIPHTSIPVFLVECDSLYNRPGIYGNPDGYEDNDLRFFVLCKAAFEVMIALNIKIDIVSAHDYHTALLLPLLKLEYGMNPLFQHTKGALTIHNAQYQGFYEINRVSTFTQWDLSFKDIQSPFLFDNKFNALYTGINFADAIIAVSPGYANEILTHEFGEGLHDIFQQHKHKLHGILNGVNYDSWNPENDKYISEHFSLQDRHCKQKGKLKLLTSKIGMIEPEALPLFGIVSRFTSQKGFDILHGCIEQLLEGKKLYLLVLGSGDVQYEEYFTHLEETFPNHCSFTSGYDEVLAHEILAYSDFFLMPSVFEPCGLTQLYALKYGTIPIVRKVGGLKDTIEDFQIMNGTGNGITFSAFNSDSLLTSIQIALEYFEHSDIMNTIIRNAMKSNFPIGNTAKEYISLFKELLTH